MENADTSEIDQPQPRQKRRRLFIKPREQIRYSFLIFGGGLIVLAIFIAIFMITLNYTISALANIYQFEPNFTDSIKTALISAVVLIIMFSLILSAIAYVAGGVFTHRIFGPMVAIEKLVAELAAGNYKARGKLRKDDEFHSLMESLNHLAEVLEARRPKGEPSRNPDKKNLEEK